MILMKYRSINSLLLFLYASSLILASLTPSLVRAEEPGSTQQENHTLGKYVFFIPRGDIRRFSGETLYFDIDFMFFSKAAQAQISFFKENGKYKCFLVAETKGFIGFLTSYIKHTYKATFDIIDDGKRLRTATFEREIIFGDDRERIFHAMDYAALHHDWFVYKNETLIKQFNEPFDKDTHLDDVLGLFYNFRNGVYGKIEKGQNYTIPTFWTKGEKGGNISHMYVYVATDRERREYEEEEGAGELEGATMLMKLKVPSDLFDTKEGDEYFWSSEHLIPLEAIYKDFFLFGDLHIKLVKQVIPGRKGGASKH